MNWFSPHKILIQGITSYQAAFYALQMKAQGTNIVAGVSPGNGGTKVSGTPVFDLVEQALSYSDQIDISLIFVEPYQVLDAATEAIAARIRRLIIFTSQVPPLDTIKLIQRAQKTDTLILGPGSHGILIPQELWLGNLHPQFYRPGTIGLITTSRHLCHEVAAELNAASQGQSIVVSLGNDRIIGSNLPYWLSILNGDARTSAIVVIGQRIDQVEAITAYVRDHGHHKPLIFYLAGLQTPQEQVYNDAPTIISNHLSASIPVVNRDRQKTAKLREIGIKLAQRPSEIPTLINQICQS
ncbi:MAG: CoA-binding protein [Cyanobacteria bacterium J06621_8]